MNLGNKPTILRFEKHIYDLIVRVRTNNYTRYDKQRGKDKEEKIQYRWLRKIIPDEIRILEKKFISSLSS